MPVLSGQSLGKAYQATEARNHRGVRIRDHLGKGRRPIPGYQTHENRELRTTGNARPPQSQVTEPLESVRDVRNSARGFRVLKPSQKSTVYTWAQELLMMRASAAHIENSLSAIQFCHNSYGFRLPLSRKFEFRNLSKAIASLKGTPKRLFFPVTKEHLRKMMHLRNLTAAQERAVIITSTRSQLCCRVSEVRNFQVCDFLKDQDMAFSSRSRGCAAF